MTSKEAQKVLNELDGVRPEELTGEAQKLFEAIMKIADERDELRIQLKVKEKIINYIIQEQIEDGYLVNFKSIEEATNYYKNKIQREEE